MKGQDKKLVYVRREGPMRSRVYVAMSGGVDSSVAAALLKRRGFNVVGVFMKPYQSNYGTWNMKYRTKNGSPHSIVYSPCLWQKDREDAMRVAARIGIPLLTWDFSKEYKREVTDYMIREYRAGRTPNPDVMCNKHIKFGLFLRKALENGADYIATGHYVRIKPKGVTRLGDPRRAHWRARRGKIGAGPRHGFSLHTAVDTNKDQSYFLWTLRQEQLKYCLFPIGDYTKPEVRNLAKKFGLPTADKKDSQGVCFIGPLDMKGFLQKYIKPKKGDILDIKGQKIGTHDGIFYYTIGQRHGLDIKSGKGPYFVVKKDANKNIICVGTENDLKNKEAKISNINLINKNLKFPALVEVKIRYRNKSEKATLSKDGFLRFKNLVKAITSGQSAVFYKDEELLGGGIIK